MDQGRFGTQPEYPPMHAAAAVLSKKPSHWQGKSFAQKTKLKVAALRNAEVIFKKIDTSVYIQIFKNSKAFSIFIFVYLCLSWQLSVLNQ